MVGFAHILPLTSSDGSRLFVPTIAIAIELNILSALVTFLIVFLLAHIKVELL